MMPFAGLTLVVEGEMSKQWTVPCSLVPNLWSETTGMESMLLYLVGSCSTTPFAPVGGSTFDPGPSVMCRCISWRRSTMRRPHYLNGKSLQPEDIIQVTFTTVDVASLLNCEDYSASHACTVCCGLRQNGCYEAT